MQMRVLVGSALLALSLMNVSFGQGTAAPSSLRVYFGTYSGAMSKGIYHSTLDLTSGQLSAPELSADVKNPSFVAIHPTGKFLYAVSEISDFQGKPLGGVSAFSIDAASGKLTLLNQQSSTGAGPCHLVVDAAGKNVLVANYGGGSVASLPIDATGMLAEASASIQHTGSSVNKSRQEKPHAHSINLDRANKFAFAADLGLDKVLIYKFDAARGSLVANDPPAGVVSPGSGPRHFAFHPSNRFAFVNNEMTSSITSFQYDAAKGSLTEIHTLSTLPHDVAGNSTAETVVHPSGKFVYVSNRGHDSIAIFTLDEASGKLTAAGHCPTGGKTPRNFNVDPTGQYLLAANQSTNDVFTFRIDAKSGQLTPVGTKIEVGSPVCIRFATK
jgi:6-phosphogluconolactonase